MPCPLKHANEIMQCWWDARERVRTGGGQLLMGASSEHWLRTATYAANVEYADGSGTYAQSMFAYADVIGMYVRPRGVPEGEEWKYGGQK